MDNEFMKTKPIFSLLMSMSIPMMLSMLMQALYNIVDSIYVSYLGTDALTAVSIAFPLQNMVASVAVGVGVGITSTISIYLGSKKQEEANTAATIGIALSILHCILFILIGIFVTKPFLRLFTTDPSILKQACDYTYIVVCLSFGTIIQIAMEKIFQAVGAMKTTMFLLATGCIINIILDPILIFGYFGFPAMGVRGAAIATVTGQICGFILYIIVYLKKSFGITIHPKYLIFDKSVIRQIYSVGIPSSLMMMLPSILVSVLNRILARFSDLYIAVLGVYFKLQTFIYMPANGIVQGMRPIVGYNYGAKDYDRMKKTIQYSLLSAGMIMLLGTISALAIPTQIFSLFKADQEMLTAGTMALRIISLGFLISTIGIIYSGTFEAIGKGKESLIISILRQFIITIPASLLLSHFLGVVGVWIAFPLGELCASIVAYFLLKREQNGAFSPF